MLTLFLMGVVVIGGLCVMIHMLLRFLPSDDNAFILRERNNYISRVADLDLELKSVDRDFIRLQSQTRFIR